ncbi:hypothetical protein BGZ99_001746 [Dissophora globulifera]|uniref:RNA ligase domain-containing protein n=1 Tax=Dissophora globulifera TaxID=979702 RepID=A0A9P6RPD0_9FUNG|nr:hypothetical protein BGZ99_001746 [Dissophora globulifera]
MVDIYSDDDESQQSQAPVDVILARAAAAFKDADFFESSTLFWAAALDQHRSQSPDSEHDDALTALASGLDIEQELGLDVQAEDPIDLIFPSSTGATTTAGATAIIRSSNISSIQTYILTALCYLSRHINVRIDILPSGQSTLTSMGPPQRYYISLTPHQKQIYRDMLAIVFATTSSIAIIARRNIANSGDGSVERLAVYDQQMQVQQTTVMGNTTTVTWQTALTEKRTPHNLPRFFSFLDTNSCTVAGSSIPRNEADIDAMEQAGFRLVITLIKESPLSATWFHTDGSGSGGSKAAPKLIKNAFVPIENRKAPTFPEVFEVLMGWCARTGNGSAMKDEAQVVDDELADEPLSLQSLYPHRRATLIHCGGGKGRAGIVLAAHLIRFGLLGHAARGYCADCLHRKNVHSYDLEQFRKGLGDQASVASTLPKPCSSLHSELDDAEDQDQDDVVEDILIEGHVFRPVQKGECLNRYQPQMTAKDAMAHLRELRPGSIETTEQEKAVKAYGDWLWKRSSSSSGRHSKSTPSTITHSVESDVGATDKRSKTKKDAKKEHVTKQKPEPAATPSPQPVRQEDDDDMSDDDHGRGGRKSGKKGKKGSKKLPPEPPRAWVPVPKDKIIKIPGSQHHQHHLIVQHNARARQIQRGQKSKNNDGGGGKHSKDRPSYQLSGSPLITAPKLVILAGLPGSGKSHVVTSLLSEYPEHFVRISQDELGSRAVCERLLAQSMRHQQTSLAARGAKNALPMTIFVDRCNPTIAERKEWYEVAFQPAEAIMVWFSQSVEQCIERVDSREAHPTVSPGMGPKVVRSFAKGFEFPNLAKEGSWCKTLIEVGDDAGSDRLVEIFKKFAKEVPSTSSMRASNAEATPIKVRPAFIPARVLQRKNNAVGGHATSGEPGFDSPSTHLKLASSGSMESVEEEEEEEEDDEDDSDEDDEDDSDDEDDKEEEDGEDDEDKHGDDSNGRSEDEEGRDQSDQDDDSSKDHNGTPTKRQDGKHERTASSTSNIAGPASSSLSTNVSITRALQFASPTGHRPSVKKPAKGSWKSSEDAVLDTRHSAPSSPDLAEGLVSPKGVKFASPLSTFDRPLQKFPRTPHLFDPLTVLLSLEQGTDRISGDVADIKETEVSSLPCAQGTRSAAISRSDLLLPPSALHQVFSPKRHQVLTVEEKMDGANIGFSVLHFKTMNGFSSVAGSGPAPKIRVQNRNHFVHPDDHWQFKKLTGWLDRHREDVLWLCEGRWRYETRTRKGHQDDQDDSDATDNDAVIAVVAEDDRDQAWEDEEEDENEYVDEDKVLQDGLAPYVLYGEWLYAKHSVQYTGLRSWFVPFDLYDIKTGTFVSRALFRKALERTQLSPNPTIAMPTEIYGHVDKTLNWTLEMLQSRSAMMRKTADTAKDNKDEVKDRVEGLYFRIDQGDRLLMRSKVVRPDFIAGEERWGAKEQVANQLVFYEETLPNYHHNDEEEQIAVA